MDWGRDKKGPTSGYPGTPPKYSCRPLIESWFQVVSKYRPSPSTHLRPLIPKHMYSLQGTQLYLYVRETVTVGSASASSYCRYKDKDDRVSWLPLKLLGT